MARDEQLAFGSGRRLRSRARADPSRRQVLGWAVFGGTSVACVTALALDLHTSTYATLGYVLIAEALASMGIVLTSRMPWHRVSWVLALSALGWAIASLAFAYAVEGLVDDPGAVPGAQAAAWLDNWAWLPGLALPLAAMLLLIPDGHLMSRRWWPVPVCVGVGVALASFAKSTSPTFDLSGTSIDNPLALDSAAVTAAGFAGVLLASAGVLASLVAFTLRYRRSQGDERQQLRWVGLSLALAVPLAAGGALLWGVVPGAQALPALALLALPAGIAIAVLKYRLYDLDIVVNRALVYGAMTIAVITGYVAIVGLVGSYVSRRGDIAVSLLVTGIAAVCFQPLRERVQRSVNRLMYGERDDPYAAIAGLGRTLSSATQLEAVLPAAVETIGRTLALQYVAVTIPGDDAETIAAYGTRGGTVQAFPLVHQGISMGELRLTPLPGEERLRERDRRLVDDLAPQVAAALHALALSRELQATRQRVVGLREEERRRIRRDLHDGLGPALAGLTFTLEAVRNLADTDVGRADELLVAATGQVQTMIGDIRRLIYGLRPPALDQLGLTASLRGLATREALPEVDVHIEAPNPLPALPAAIEVAAYWITQEALTNVKRHAQARTCRVRLEIAPDELRLEIEDDGAGFATGSTGIGLQTMKERAAEVGGTCEIEPRTTGGTRVTACLPRPRANGSGR